MKILSLNTWEGRVHTELLPFIAEQGKVVDIFCLQEVPNGKTGFEVLDSRMRETLYRELADQLPNHVGYFAPVQSGVYELAMFVHKNIFVEHTGDVVVHLERDSFTPDNPNSFPRNLQYVVIAIENKKITVCNLHGLWYKGANKTDIPERIKQSEIIRDFMNKIEGEKVLIGDYNLLPDTESIKILDTEMGMENLITRFGITSTRNSHYDKFNSAPLYADYAHVSKGIVVNEFQVLPDIVSDHQPLLLDFDIVK